jgi:LPXTG-motif cell wall-anchored protein
VGALAFTGSPTTSLALLGLIIVASGTTLTVLARRRRGAHPDAPQNPID